MICETADDRGDLTCNVRPTWQVTAGPPSAQSRETSHGLGSGDTDAAPPSWLCCQPHLGEAVMLVDENYGGPVTVQRWPA